MKKKEFEDIYRNVFNDSSEWRRWFFTDVVTDDSQIYLSRESSGKATGALLMQPYDFLFHGRTVLSEYMSCVATRPEARAHGIASGLIREALRSARERGVAICHLVPASDHLYFFYDRLGFATTFYLDRERFTSLHTFEAGDFVPVEPSYATFSRLERAFGCGVVHSAANFVNLLADNSLDGGRVVAVRDAAGSEAILFAAGTDGIVRVKCLLADNRDAAEAALSHLRDLAGEVALMVERPPLSGEKCFLRPYGMARIVDPMPLLAAIAAEHPGLNYAIYIKDPIIAANTGYYTLRNGECRKPVAFGGHADLEVRIDTLAAVLFSNERIGKVLELPVRRPYMALMLD